jgi:hypothetical protein
MNPALWERLLIESSAESDENNLDVESPNMQCGTERNRYNPFTVDCRLEYALIIYYSEIDLSGSQM